MSLRLNKAQRERLRAVASRLYREGDDHTMSGGFGVYSEGEAVKAACEDLEACLALLRETLEAFDDAAPDGVSRPKRRANVASHHQERSAA